MGLSVKDGKGLAVRLDGKAATFTKITYKWKAQNSGSNPE